MNKNRIFFPWIHPRIIKGEAIFSKVLNWALAFYLSIKISFHKDSVRFTKKNQTLF